MLHFISHIYVVLVLAFYIDVQSDKMTLLKCLAVFRDPVQYAMS